MTKPLDQKLVKKTYTRLIISGDHFKLYNYEKPIFYNWAPNGATTLAGAQTDSPNGSSPNRREDSLKRSRDGIRRLILSNAAAYGEKLKFVTFTFRENVTDIEEAMVYWAEYSRRLNNRLGISMRYLTVIEFTKNDRVHFHTLYFNMPFIYGLKKVIEKEWGQGFIKVKALDAVKNIGIYVSKYLRKGNNDKRLNGKKAYFCSKGLLKPTLIREKNNVSWFLNNSKIEVELEGDFCSKNHGVINYKTGKYANNNR